MHACMGAITRVCVRACARACVQAHVRVHLCEPESRVSVNVLVTVCERK